MSFSAADVRFMSRALQLAEQACYTAHPNPRVGCVLVRDEQICGEGAHLYAGGPHAEVVALAAAGEAARGATAYVTLEPCNHYGRTGPCTHALLSAGVTRVVAAMRDPNPQVNGSGLAKLSAAGVAVADGLLQAQAEHLNRGFIARMTRQRPWVRVKFGMSLDGSSAAANGESKWITGTAARQDVQRLRATSGAILTGLGTILADDPQLNVREWPMLEANVESHRHQPLRVVVDSQLRIPIAARVLAADAANTIVFTAAEGLPRFERVRATGATVLATPSTSDGRVDLADVLYNLAKREINDVLVEAGPTLCGELLGAELVDEIVLYTAPVILGDRGRGLFSVPGLDKLSDRVELQIVDARAVGVDWRITAVPIYRAT